MAKRGRFEPKRLFVMIGGAWMLHAPALEGRGLSAFRAQHFLESTEHPIYTPAADEHFGSALATGDFDGDGVDDLAIGIPRDRHLFAADPVGQVQIRYGGAGAGLPGGIFVDYIWQGGTSSLDPPENDDRYGCSLAAGNFNADPYDDLAIGVCHEAVGAVDDAGAVEIRYGGPDGLSHDGPRQMFHQDSSGLAQVPEAFDRFGNALAVGDFDGNGFDDLAIGVAKETVGADTENGCVQVLYGGGAGLTTAESDYFDGSELGYSAGDFFHFGFALAAGDFDGDGFDDLAIGSPGRNGVGALFAVDGGPDGLGKIPAVYLHQAVEGVEDVGEPGDRFGAALFAGHFGADAYADLAVGVPFEDTGLANEVVDAGCAHLFFGNEGGLSGLGSQYWVASIAAVPGGQDAGDRFGAAVAGGDFDRNGFADLAIGVPGDPILAATDVGEIVVLPGTSLGPVTTGAQAWSFTAPGVPGSPGAGDQLGSSLAAGDFNADGHEDLAAGAPYADSDFPQAGSTLVLYGALFADGFESGDRSAWSFSAP